MNRTLAVPIFTLLMALGANIVVPMGDVPFILSDLFVLLAGLLLGGWMGGLSVALYLVLGFLNLPVFAEGGYGFERMTGPTGGYLLGYLLGSFAVGKIAYAGKKTLLRDGLATVTGQAIIFALGLTGLMVFAKMNPAQAVAVGLSPFFIPILIKFTLAVLLARLLRPYMRGTPR